MPQNKAGQERDVVPLYIKMLAVMDEVGHIEKDATNTHQKYQYASEKAIKEAFQAAFIKHNIIFRMQTRNPRVIGSALYIDVKYSFVDADTSEAIHGVFVGSGQTRDEKGYYAAITGAIKYILTSNFLTPTGDDPEKDEGPYKATKGEGPDKANLATPEQRKMILNLGRLKHNKTADVVMDTIKTKLKLDAFTDITSVQATKIIDEWQKAPDYVYDEVPF